MTAPMGQSRNRMPQAANATAPTEGLAPTATETTVTHLSTAEEHNMNRHLGSLTTAMFTLVLAFWSMTSLAIDEVTIEYEGESQGTSDPPWLLCQEDSATANFTAEATGLDTTDVPTIDWTWEFNGTTTSVPDGGTSISFNVPRDDAGEFDLEVTATVRDNTDDSASDTDDVTVIQVEIKKPTGDPSTTEGANPGNERTYSTAATDPTVTVVCKGKTSGNDDGLRWKIEDVGSIKATWDPHVDGNEHIGKGKKSTATYTGLPANNSDFGSKTITLSLVDTPCSDEQEVEIFFPKNATNHPGGQAGSPNWFHYWGQAVQGLLRGDPKPSLTYSATGSSFSMGDTHISLSDGDATSYSAPLGENNPLTGIDNFAWTAVHESTHYFHALTWWGNAVATHAAATGKEGADDDKDGEWLPNKIEDTNLNKAFDGDSETWDWTKPLTPGAPDNRLLDDEEWKNCLDGKAATGDHTKDWADPGMQHKTVDKYDD